MPGSFELKGEMKQGFVAALAVKAAHLKPVKRLLTGKVGI
jgi:hypothetical protein